MRARVKQSHPIGTTTACGGIQFNKRDWQTVPAHEEAAALRDEALEIEPEPEPVIVEAAPEIEPESAPVESPAHIETVVGVFEGEPEPEPEPEPEDKPAPKRKGK